MKKFVKGFFNESPRYWWKLATFTIVHNYTNAEIGFIPFSIEWWLTLCVTASIFAVSEINFKKD